MEKENFKSDFLDFALEDEHYVPTEDDIAYDKEATGIRKYYDTLLLTELLYINHKYPDSVYSDKDLYIFNTLFDTLAYTNDELNQMIKDAINIVKIKYDMDIDIFEAE